VPEAFPVGDDSVGSDRMLSYVGCAITVTPCGDFEGGSVTGDRARHCPGVSCRCAV